MGKKFTEFEFLLKAEWRQLSRNVPVFDESLRLLSLAIKHFSQTFKSFF